MPKKKKVKKTKKTKKTKKNSAWPTKPLNRISVKIIFYKNFCEKT